MNKNKGQTVLEYLILVAGIAGFGIWFHQMLSIASPIIHDYPFFTGQ